jgi:hypothetical protein
MMSIERAVFRLRILICAAFCVGSLTVAQNAAAQSVPRQCSVKAGQAAKYTAGLSAGQQKADNFFASTEIARSPKKLQNKISRVLERLHQHIRDAMDQDVGQGRRCRIQGVTDGFLSRIAQLLGQCVLDGGTWGQFTAELYCELAAELGGLGEPTPFMRVPVGLCGTLFQQVCDGVYGYVATEGGESLAPPVKSFLSSRDLNVSTYPGCVEFTEGAFESTFASARSTDCAYGAQ